MLSPYYQDGYVTLYHGDCLDLLDQIEADVLVTDPPYGIAWRKGENKVAGSAARDGIQGDEDTSARDAALDAWGDKPGIVFGSFYAPMPPRLKQVLVWGKPADSGVVGSVTGYRRDAEPVFLVGDWPTQTVRWSSVLPHGAGSIANVTRNAGHPHAKPIGLMTSLIERCPPGVILDPFAGSGSTLRAAKNLGRKAIGIEIEERYCEIIVKRLAQEVLL